MTPVEMLGGMNPLLIWRWKQGEKKPPEEKHTISGADSLLWSFFSTRTVKGIGMTVLRICWVCLQFSWRWFNLVCATAGTKLRNYYLFYYYYYPFYYYYLLFYYYYLFVTRFGLAITKNVSLEGQWSSMRECCLWLLQNHLNWQLLINKHLSGIVWLTLFCADAEK